TLTKTGSVNTTASTVTWQINATKGQTQGGKLMFSGTMTGFNSGNGGGTIRNTVLNLQRPPRSTWSARSTNSAGATHRDAATTAHMSATASSENRNFFSENSASGTLEFMDARTNTVFSLVPEVTIAPNSSVKLLFSAAFDNNVLALADGTLIR